MAVEKLNLAVLISGRGSNMKAIAEACCESDFPAVIKVVISNRPDAAGLIVARDFDIETRIVDHKKYADRDAFDAALQSVLDEYTVDLICLAGFMRILSAGFVSAWPGRVLNVHPSLLPAYKGLHPYERVLADGGTESGCTVHIVTPELDDGPILVQRRVPILAGDTPDILAARILIEEHAAYPAAIRQLAGQIQQTRQLKSGKN